MAQPSRRPSRSLPSGLPSALLLAGLVLTFGGLLMVAPGQQHLSGHGGAFLQTLFGAANFGIAIAFFTIAALIFRALYKEGRPERINALGIATGLIFFCCGLSHLLHLLHPLLGGGHDLWLTVQSAVDLSTLAAAALFFALRERYHLLTGGEATLLDMQDRLRERQRAEAALRESNERFRATFEQAAVGITHLSPDGRWLRVNQKFCDVIGRTRQELHQLHLDDVKNVNDREADRVASQRLLTGEVPMTKVEKRYLRRDGSAMWASVTSSLVRDAAGTPQYIINVVQDISQRKELEDRLMHQAFHDALTGLPNRALFLDRLSHGVAGAARRDAPLAVLFLDLDGFKVVNDSLGHDAGDALLVEVSRRLTGCLRPGDTVARLGGDEIAILLPEVSDPADAVRVAERVIATLQTPMPVRGHQMHVGVSIGIALHSNRQAQPGDLLREADIALYQAKGAGKGRAILFDAHMNEAAVDRLRWESDLRHAVAREELRLVYQPQVDLASGAIVGVEALVRWQHPRYGLLNPNEFIPLAEETGLIIPLGKWVVREACREALTWEDLNPEIMPPVVSVNLSARQLQDAGLSDWIAATLRESGLPANRLCIEITEGTAMQDAISTTAILYALRGLGVRLALDDFGMGYSSLGYLQRFPVDTIKIDRSFVSGVDQGGGSVAIVRAVTALAHALGMDVTAEGIETEVQRRHMDAVQCDQGQGYLFARPMSAATLAGVLRRGQLDQAGRDEALLAPVAACANA
jgi:diguanylate cyclase (GGDEF)-like protein/PAS domain S-box-containing protein